MDADKLKEPPHFSPICALRSLAALADQIPLTPKVTHPYARVRGRGSDQGIS
jgi:hypothetical protein